MALSEHEVDIPVGRRSMDGHVRVSIFARDMLALRLEGTSERSPTCLLTLEQARSLKQALDRLIPLVESSEMDKNSGVQASGWQGEERRGQAENR